MKRNPLIPFLLIAVIGIALMLTLSFNGLNNAKEIAAEKEGGGAEQQASAKPEEIYQKTCIGCHGDQYQGGVGPSLKGIGKKVSQEEIANIVVNGKGNMPAGLVPPEKAKEMAKWVSEIK
ncbi:MULTISPECIES: cytochrome c550 [Priestia]|uniref:cytochrome c550 n=1 Tax=Priestia TaxID=2800373 RepID=UPI00064E498A|nr:MULTISPECIES: cytochrome c [Priestia]MCL9636740.1 cytochrome c [Bacillus zanthoxyli]KML29191.1 cytochrome C [Priestia aryabhattai]KMO01185.1 cytochrome C [Priestia aryabhattai]MCA1051881.1 cytochrome c [Priestia aryabhattai]MCQ9281882.1 cytochrome c [Priestia aryabhattai]